MHLLDYDLKRNCRWKSVNGNTWLNWCCYVECRNIFGVVKLKLQFNHFTCSQRRNNKMLQSQVKLDFVSILFGQKIFSSFQNDHIQSHNYCHCQFVELKIVDFEWRPEQRKFWQTFFFFFFFWFQPFFVVDQNVRISHGHENQEYLSKLLLH